MREFTVKVTGRVEDLFEEEDFHDALYSYSTHMGLGFDIDFEAKENVPPTAESWTVEQYKSLYGLDRG